MKRWGHWNSGFILILITAFFLILPALAHVPVFGGEGKSPEEAIPVEDPSKSRVLYGQLSGVGDVRYYSFEMEKGDRILLGLIVPVESGSENLPDLILMGPGLASEEEKNGDAAELPETVEIPEGAGAKVIFGRLPERATYEGFSPSVFYSLARLDLEAPESGTYYAAVNSPAGGGNYGVVLGYRETFSLREWIFVPLNQVRIYRWEGQGLASILAPLLLTLAIGLLAVLRTKAEVIDFNPERWSGTLAGLLFLGTGLSFLFQMLFSISRSAYTPEIFLTLFLAFSHLGLGIAAMVLALKERGYGENEMKKRLYFFGLALAGLLLWAGWIVGPFLAIEAGILPWDRK